MKILTIVCSLLYSGVMLAQHSQSDSSYYHRMIDGSKKLYVSSLRENLLLYSGPEYISSYHRAIGHPFFVSDSAIKGSVFYREILYSDVALSYNLAEDNVYIKDYGRNYNIRLVDDKIGYFSVLGHLFVKIDPDSNTGKLPDAGFYDLVYDSEVALLVKRAKKLTSSSMPEDPMIFVTYERYFIRRNGNYYPVKNRAELIAALSDKAAEIRKFIRKNHIRLKKNAEQAILKTIVYYDQLK